MTKAELVEALADRHFDGNKAEATRMLNAVVEVIIASTAASGKVGITGFGVFERVRREARTVRNPKTGARKEVEAFDFPRFRPGAALTSMVAGNLPVPVWATKAAARSAAAKKA